MWLHRYFDVALLLQGDGPQRKAMKTPKPEPDTLLWLCYFKQDLRQHWSQHASGSLICAVTQQARLSKLRQPRRQGESAD
jgi:hypothetical protein